MHLQALTHSNKLKTSKKQLESVCPQRRCIECCDTDLLLHLFEAKYFKQQILCFLHLSRSAIIGNYVLVHGLQFFTQLKEQFSFVHFFLKPNLPRPPER